MATIKQIQAYTDAGAYLFATLPSQKHNGEQGGYKNSFNSAPDLQAWMKSHHRYDKEQSGLGIDLDKSPFLVIDIDNHTQSGMASLERWLQTKGESVQSISQGAYIEQTPSGGWHLIYRYTGDIKTRLVGTLDGVDVLTAGGITVAPTELPAGLYRQISALNINKIQNAPSVVVELLTHPPKVSADSASNQGMKATSRTGDIMTQIINGVEAGGRNHFIAQLSGWLLSYKTGVTASASDIYSYIQEINATKISPPLDEQELYNTFNSIYRKEKKTRDNINRKRN